MHVRYAPLEKGVPLRRLKLSVEMREIRQFGVIELSKKTELLHRSDKTVGGKDHIPAGVAAHDFRQHFLRAAVNSVTDPAMEAALELRDRRAGDIVVPVINIQPMRAARGAAREGSGHTH